MSAKLTEGESEELKLDEKRNGAKAVRDILNRYGLQLSKSMGQNFLIDANIPEKIVRLSNVDSSCGVLEIGPGLGALTSALGRAAARVTAVELDGKLMPLLSETLAGLQNVEIVRGDILKLDIAGLVNQKMPEMKHIVCANLPYNITTPTLTALIDADAFDSITVMIQREVARRICAKPGSPEYGAFTVYANYHTEPEILFDVPPECFIPRPGVFSSVLFMKPRKQRFLDAADEALFFRVVRAAFGQRRKTLVNSLSASFGSAFTKEEIAGFVANCGFDARVRGETLGIEEFVKLSSKFVTSHAREQRL